MYLYSISPVGIQETYIRMSHRDISASVQDLFVRKHILDVRHPNHCSRLVSTLPLFAPLSSYAARLCVAQLLQQLTSIQLSEGNCVNTGDLRSTPPTGHLRCSAHFLLPAPSAQTSVCATITSNHRLSRTPHPLRVRLLAWTPPTTLGKLPFLAPRNDGLGHGSSSASW